MAHKVSQRPRHDVQSERREFRTPIVPARAMGMTSENRDGTGVRGIPGGDDQMSGHDRQRELPGCPPLPGRAAAEPSGLSRARTLPARYYQDHFAEMLAFVIREYRPVLTGPDHRLIEAFRALDADAQGLYVRLANRKGRVFRAGKLNYPELGDLDLALRSLRRSGWLGVPDRRDVEHVLRAVTRSELHAALSSCRPGIPPGLRKADLIELARAHASPDEWLTSQLVRGLFALRRTSWVRFLLFLYFGDAEGGLNRFALRDMGRVRAKAGLEGFEPRFSDPQEARNAFFYALKLRSAGLGLPVDLSGWPEPMNDMSARLRDRLAVTLGRRGEAAGQTDRALAAYALGTGSECRERRVRLLLSAGHKEQAGECLDAWLADPAGGDDLVVAADLRDRVFGRKRTTPATDLLKQADFIDLDDAWAGAAERGAVDYFRRKGIEAWRAENRLWRTLFGLTFWPLLYGPGKPRARSPFDRLPPGLEDTSFYARRRQEIHAVLEMFDDPDRARAQLLKTSAANYDTPNGLFRWAPDLMAAPGALVVHANGSAIATVLEAMARDYRRMRHGFPDLLVVEDSVPRFVEIKADGDALRPNQVARLVQLRRAGFAADVIRVRWRPDPGQVYVVVDVETTGGRGPQHRITELGAVKLRDGVVIDRYQTLLNPQRRIPSRITRLTGISEAMVAAAPDFSDVADSFAQFLKDAVFVAHNVNFDYGFVQQEFARLGRKFRRPKLCTCASMRKLFPGRRSYALAPLSREFGIDLARHHRALCDAEAAAALLVIIQERRNAGQTGQ